MLGGCASFYHARSRPCVPGCWRSTRRCRLVRASLRRLALALGRCKGGLGHRERRRSSVRLAGAAARFDAVPARAHAAGGVRMRFRHRAARVEHQQAPALRAHQASRSHRTVIGRCGFAFAWRGTCKFIECHVSWPLSSTAHLSWNERVLKKSAHAVAKSLHLRTCLQLIAPGAPTSGQAGPASRHSFELSGRL